jgi:hypothetical protein
LDPADLAEGRLGGIQTRLALKLQVPNNDCFLVTQQNGAFDNVSQVRECCRARTGGGAAFKYEGDASGERNSQANRY